MPLQAGKNRSTPHPIVYLRVKEYPTMVGEVVGWDNILSMKVRAPCALGDLQPGEVVPLARFLGAVLGRPEPPRDTPLEVLIPWSLVRPPPAAQREEEEESDLEVVDDGPPAAKKARVEHDSVPFIEALGEPVPGTEDMNNVGEPYFQMHAYSGCGHTVSRNIALAEPNKCVYPGCKVGRGPPVSKAQPIAQLLEIWQVVSVSRLEKAASLLRTLAPGSEEREDVRRALRAAAEERLLVAGDNAAVWDLLYGLDRREGPELFFLMALRRSNDDAIMALRKIVALRSWAIRLARRLARNEAMDGSVDPTVRGFRPEPWMWPLHFSAAKVATVASQHPHLLWDVAATYDALREGEEHRDRLVNWLKHLFTACGPTSIGMWTDPATGRVPPRILALMPPAVAASYLEPLLRKAVDDPLARAGEEYLEVLEVRAVTAVMPLALSVRAP